MLEGRIIRTYKGFYYIWANKELHECRLRGRLKVTKPDLITGDLVRFSPLEAQKGIIEEIIPRHSLLKRPAIANIDQVLLVASARNPDFSTGIVDRFLLLIAAQHLPAVICITKNDLLSEEYDRSTFEYYRLIGYPLVYLSIQDEQGIKELSHVLDDKISVLAGPSGVGKSSMLQSLLPDMTFEVGSVSEKIGRGRHTTKHANLLPWKNGAIADTPGFTSLGLQGWTKEEPKDYYPDFLEKSSDCRFRGSCLHSKEPGCAVKVAVESGQIPQWRYENYLSILAEIQDVRLY